ncbi:hypothetical protein FOC1_g10005390, partial [Fusarium oxysporum f. sp. cubense race 1]
TMTANQIVAMRGKFKRASTPKVRTGCITCNDIVEMHELVAMDMDWGSGSDSDSDTDIEEPDPPLRAPKGIPQMIEVLARKTGKTSTRLEGLYP